MAYHRFCGLKRTRPTPLPPLDREHWVFRYSSRPGNWTRTNLPPPGGDTAPPARYARQVVYDGWTRIAYLHGGSARDDCPKVALWATASTEMTHWRR